MSSNYTIEDSDSPVRKAPDTSYGGKKRKEFKASKYSLMKYSEEYQYDNSAVVAKITETKVKKRSTRKRKRHDEGAVEIPPKVACPSVECGKWVFPKLATGQKWERYFECERLIEYNREDQCNQPKINFSSEVAILNDKLAKNKQDYDAWTQLILVQAHNPTITSNAYIAARQIRFIREALKYFPQDYNLQRMLIHILEQNSPLDMAQNLVPLITRDISSYPLWYNYILSYQYAYTDCKVLNVLKKYALCTARILDKWKPKDIREVDSFIMYLFQNCGLFLRQAGHIELCLNYIKFMLESNIEDFRGLTHIYSVLPINEDILLNELRIITAYTGIPIQMIWVYSEVLHEGFHFLPLFLEDAPVDIQCVATYDFFKQFKYHIRSPQSTFQLILIGLRILKFPFLHTDTLMRRFCVDNLTDSIEDLLIMLINPFQKFGQIKMHHIHEFTKNVMKIVCEYTVNPSYINSSLGYASYEALISGYLLNCADYFGSNDDRRIALLILYCRFQRILLKINNYTKVNEHEHELMKRRLKFKNLLDIPSNHRHPAIHIENALFEYEIGTEPDAIQKMLLDVINGRNGIDRNMNLYRYHAYIVLAELQFCWGNLQNAAKLLSLHLLGSTSCHMDERISYVHQEWATEFLYKEIVAFAQAELGRPWGITVEELFIPNILILKVRGYLILASIIRTQKAAFDMLDHLVTEAFSIKYTHIDGRPKYIRELLLEQYAILLHVATPRNELNNRHIYNNIYKMLQEYPRNMIFLQLWSSLTTSNLWHKVCIDMSYLPSYSHSLLMLIISGHYRYEKSISVSTARMNEEMLSLMNLDTDFHNSALCRRIVNILQKKLFVNCASTECPQFSTIDYKIERNALLWRIFLRHANKLIFDDTVKKKWVHSALQACPGHKALYLDCIIFQPDMYSFVKNIMLYKHLRVHLRKDLQQMGNAEVIEEEAVVAEDVNTLQKEQPVGNKRETLINQKETILMEEEPIVSNEETPENATILSEDIIILSDDEDSEVIVIDDDEEVIVIDDEEVMDVDDEEVIVIDD